MELSFYERETIINYNEGEPTASVYTHNKALRRTLDKLAQERPEDCRVDRVSHEGAAAGLSASVYIKSILPARMKVKLIIIDVFRLPCQPSTPRYFFHDSHMDRFVYSPPECGKLSVTEFSPR